MIPRIVVGVLVLATPAAQESTPVAVDGRLYVQTSQGDVFAVDGATGHVIWEYRSGWIGIERGVAVAAGRPPAGWTGTSSPSSSRPT